MFSYLGLAYPFLLFCNVFFVLFWGLRRDRYALYSLGCILAGLGYLGSFFNINLSGSAQKSAGEIRIVSYNIASLDGYDWSDADKKAKLKVLLEAFKEEVKVPDVLCLQECKGDKLVELIRVVFGYPYFFKSKYTVVFSKFPIQAKDVIPFWKTGNSCVWVDLKTPKGVVRLYNAHLQSNKLGQTADKIATEGKLNDEETWRNVRFVMRRYKDALMVRAQQAQLVAKSIEESPHPTILCGDLNDPPVSYVYRLLSKNLQDSFCEKGSGFGSTFAGRLPFLRIDYVLSGKEFRVSSHRVLHKKLSDHYPVQVTLRLLSKQPSAKTGK